MACSQSQSQHTQPATPRTSQRIRRPPSAPGMVSPSPDSRRSLTQDSFQLQLSKGKQKALVSESDSDRESSSDFEVLLVDSSKKNRKKVDNRKRKHQSDRDISVSCLLLSVFLIS